MLQITALYMDKPRMESGTGRHKHWAGRHKHLPFLVHGCFLLHLLPEVSPLKSSPVATFGFVPGCTSLRKATIWVLMKGFPAQSSEGYWGESMHVLVSLKINFALASVEGGLLRLHESPPKVALILRKVNSIGFSPQAAKSPALIKFQASRSKSISSRLRFNNEMLILWPSNFYDIKRESQPQKGIGFTRST